MDIEQVKTIISDLIGLNAWGVKLGVGSFITMEFGRPEEESDGPVHGEWHLWVYCCEWRLEKEGRFLAGSGDTRDVIEAALRKVEGTVLASFEVFDSGLDAVLTFSQDLVLRLFYIYSDSYEHWMVYLPEGNVLTAGPGQGWSLAPRQASSS